MSGEEERGRELSPFAGYSFITKNIPEFKEAVALDYAPEGSVADIATSHHRAAALTLRYTTTGNEEASIVVVYKPLSKKEKENEEAVYKVLKQFPDIPSLKPAYFALDKLGNYTMATIAEADMVSLEKTVKEAVSRYYELPNDKTAAELERELSYYYRAATLCFLRLSQCGILNQDPAARNVGFKVGDGTLIGFDFENSWIPSFFVDASGNKTPADREAYKREITYLLNEITEPGELQVPFKVAKAVAQSIYEDIDALYEDPLFGTYGWTAEKEQKARDILQLNS